MFMIPAPSPMDYPWNRARFTLYFHAFLPLFITLFLTDWWSNAFTNQPAEVQWAWSFIHLPSSQKSSCTSHLHLPNFSHPLSLIKLLIPIPPLRDSYPHYHQPSMLSIRSPLIFIPILFTILDSHASGAPCTRAAPSFIFLLHAPRDCRHCSSPAAIPAPAMWALAPATVTAVPSGCRRTAATTSLSILPPVVGAPSEDDIRGEKQARRRWSFGLGFEMGFWARPC